ncbi:MAG TPA: ribonuclease HII [Methanocorpusculum sp.]|nr:ribonuclease HII [Methanocorpusculum sp.]
MTVCGVDEAGKGSVIGPMVTAGVLVKDVTELEDLDIRDSKQLTTRRRMELYDEIVLRWKTAIVVKTPAEIDARLGTMNAFTASCHASVIRYLLPNMAFVDACDVNAARFGSNVARLSGISGLLVISDHKADAKFLIVGAASIVAKVTRDLLVTELSNMFGPVGSGYPSDHVTIRFLEEYIRAHRHPPVCARQTWKTVNEIKARVSQQCLVDFF